MKLIKLIVLFVLISISTVAQEYTFENLTMEDGLPSNRVYFVFKDSKGFIWFCTDLGVCRYNGSKIETFSTQDGLADNDVFNCFEDKWGRIWFATNNGELSFFENEKFYNASNTSWLKQSGNDGIINFFVQNKNKKSFNLFKAKLGMSYLEIGLKSIKKITLQAKYDTSLFINKIYYVQDDFYISLSVEKSTQQAYGNIGSKTINLKRLKNFKLPFAFLSNGIGLQNNILLGNEIFEVNSQKKYPIKINLNQQQIFSFHQENGERFLGSTEGLESTKNGTQKKYLPGKSVTGIAKDLYGNYYFSTSKNGVYVRRLKENKSTHTNIPFSIRNIQKLKTTTLFANEENKILYFENNKWQGVKRKGRIQAPIENIIKNNNSVFLVYKNLALVRLQNKPNVFSTQQSNFESAQYSNFIFPNTFVSNVTQSAIDKNGRIFLADNSNLILIDSGLNSFQYLVLASNKSNSDASRILSLCRTTKGEIVYSSTKGFYKIVKNESYEIKKLSPLQLYKIQAFGDKLLGLTQKNQMVLISNYDNERTINIQMIQTDSEIKSTKVISHSMALYRTWENKNFALQVPNGGIKLNNVINSLQKIKLADIHSDSVFLYVNNKSNSTKIPINDILGPLYRTKLYLKNVICNQEMILPSNSLYKVNYSGEINLKLNYQTISNFKETNLIYEYAFLKNSRDTVWQTTTVPQIQFINPTWGEYKILTRTINSTLKKSNIVATNLLIKKPFYATWLFIILVLLLAVLLTYLLTKRIQNRKRERALEEKEDEKKFLQAEFKSLNALMNPHFIFNSLNNIQGFINSDEKRKANDYLEIFSQLIRQNMHNVKQGLIGLDKEVTLVLNYLSLEKMRMTDRLSYSTTIDQDLDLEEILIPPLTIQPIIENCVKHGIFPLTERNGFIQLKIEEMNDYISIIVLDNGIGYSLSESKKTSNAIGIENIKNRFDKLSKILDKTLSVTIEDRVANGKIVGTKVEIRIYETLIESNQTKQ